MQDSSGGILLGTPNAIDAAASPIDVAITAMANNEQVTAIVKINVSKKNSAPFLSRQLPQVIEATEGVSFSFDFSDYVSDADNDALSYTIVPQLPANSGLGIDASAGVLAGVPTSSYISSSPRNMTLVVQDTGDEISQFPWRLLVSKANQAPQATQIPNATATINEVYIFPVATYFSDPDQDVLTFSVVNLPANSGLSMDPTSGILSGTPNQFDLSAAQPIILVITARDAKNAKVSANFALTVKNANNQPIAQSIPNVNAVQSVNLEFDVRPYFRDPDDDHLSFSISPQLSANSGFTFQNGILSGVASAADLNAAQPIIFVVSATDNRGSRVQTPLYIYVSPANQVPVALTINQIQEWTEGDTKAFNVSKYFYDSDGDVLRFTVTGLPPGSNLYLHPTTGILTGVLSSIDVTDTPHVFNFTATDGKGGTAHTAMRVRITKVDRPPTSKFIPESRATQGEPFFMSLGEYFEDPDGDEMTLNVVNLPYNSGLSFNNTTNILSGVPNQNDLQAKQLTLLVTATTGNGAYTTRPLVLTVDPMNRAPIISQNPLPDARGRIGSAFAYSFAPYFSDPEGEALIYSVIGLPMNTGLQLDSLMGVLQGVPTVYDITSSSPRSLIIMVRDSRNATASSLLKLIVNAANKPPEVVRAFPQMSSSRGANFAADLRLFFNEPDQFDPLAFTVSGLPDGTGFVLNATTGVLSGAPTTADFKAQPINATVIVTDTSGAYAQQSLTLKVRVVLFFDSTAPLPFFFFNGCLSVGIPSF